MYKNATTAGTKILVSAAVIACIAVMVLSAAAASAMYRPSGDYFTSELCGHLAELCGHPDYGLSKTQLKMIENAQIKSIRYEDGSDGNRFFSAKLLLCAPVAKAGSYSDNPSEYLRQTEQSMFDGEAEEIEIMGLCGDGENVRMPVIDVETVGAIAEAADRAWQNEKLTSDKNFEYAVTDMIIPEPFTDRVITAPVARRRTHSARARRSLPPRG